MLLTKQGGRTSRPYIFAGLKDDPGTYRGPIVTVSWAIYFALMAWITSNHKVPVLALLPFALLGLYLYRRDKVVSIGARPMLVRA